MAEQIGKGLLFQSISTEEEANNLKDLKLSIWGNPILFDESYAVLFSAVSDHAGIQILIGSLSKAVKIRSSRYGEWSGWYTVS